MSEKKQYAPLTLSDTMPFGRHKGTLIEDLCDSEPDYVRWLLGTDCAVASEVAEYLEENDSPF